VAFLLYVIRAFLLVAIESMVTFHLRVQYSMAFIALMCTVARRSPSPNLTKIGQEVWHVRAHVHWGPSVRPVDTNSGLLDICSCTSAVPCVLRHGRTDGRGLHIKPSSFALRGRPNNLAQRTSSQEHEAYAGAGCCSGST